VIARFLSSSRLLILLPIIGLGLSAAMAFTIGGLGLIRLVFTIVFEWATGVHPEEAHPISALIVEIVEYVHAFLVGTVLYITAVGLYQLFIGKIDFAGWLRIKNTEELETNLVGVTVVVLAVNFLGVSLARPPQEMLLYGAGIALPIAALGVFIGLRAWAQRQTEMASETHSHVIHPNDEPDSD
jgi:uncharacterized membrane protein YqhA